jgi:hypothetical protein
MCRKLFFFVSAMVTIRAQCEPFFFRKFTQILEKIFAEIYKVY